MSQRNEVASLSTTHHHPRAATYIPSYTHSALCYLFSSCCCNLIIPPALRHSSTRIICTLCDYFLTRRRMLLPAPSIGWASGAAKTAAKRRRRVLCSACCHCCADAYPRQQASLCSSYHRRLPASAALLLPTQSVMRHVQLHCKFAMSATNERECKVAESHLGLDLPKLVRHDRCKIFSVFGSLAILSLTTSNCRQRRPRGGKSVRNTTTD